MSAPGFDPTASLKCVRDVLHAKQFESMKDARDVFSAIDAEIALQGQVDRAAEMALECVGYREPRFDPTAAKNALANDIIVSLERTGLRLLPGERSTILGCVREHLSAAISAIEGPEDGAGEIAVASTDCGHIACSPSPTCLLQKDVRVRSEAASARSQTAELQPSRSAEEPHKPSTSLSEIERVAKWLEYIAAEVMRDIAFAHNLREASALIRRLATRAPSESAVVTDEMVERALDAYYGAEARMGAYEMDENKAMRAALTAALSKPEDQITREARDE